MPASMYFIRTIFAVLCSLFMTVYMIALPVGSLFMKVLAGIGLGGLFSFFVFYFDAFFRKCHLRNFNITLLGLVLGYLMGRAINVIFHSLLSVTFLAFALHQPVVELLQVAMFLFSVYLGVIMTHAWSDEVALCIPFVTLKKDAKKSRDVLVDLSGLCDTRTLELAQSHILDERLVVANWILKELRSMTESAEEDVRNRGRKGLEVVKKLEDLPHLKLRVLEDNVPDQPNFEQKVLATADQNGLNVLTAYPPSTNAKFDLRYINLQTLSTALRPSIPTGDTINIKVQRYGKEPKQGVGYLDDGTMVVINNGGDFIGESIETQVISVKQTSAGRIIFTNAVIDEENMKLRTTAPAYETRSIFENS